jgi:hypothetical protein
MLARVERDAEPAVLETDVRCTAHETVGPGIGKNDNPAPG